MWRNAEEWDKDLPNDLRPAVKHLRDTFDRVHFAFGWTTRQLCYCYLHDSRMDDDINEHVKALKQLRTKIRPSANQRFDELLKEATPPAIFTAFRQFYIDGVTIQAVLIFGQLLEIGTANQERLALPASEWANAQTQHMVRSNRHLIGQWIKNACHKQVSQPDDDSDEGIYWRRWQAPRLLKMRPSHLDPFTAGEAWNPLSLEDSAGLLDHFEVSYVVHVEARVREAAGEAALLLAKKPRAERLNSMTDVEDPVPAAHIDLLRIPEGLRSSGDPVVGNPFRDDDPRHTVWADATQRAEQELRVVNAAGMGVLNEVQPTTPSEARRVIVAFQGQLVTSKFDIWAKRGVHIVWSEPDEQSFAKWLEQYANAWLNEISQFFPAELGNIDWLLEELRTRLIARIEYWKSEARRYLNEQAKERNAPVSSLQNSEIEREQGGQSGRGTNTDHSFSLSDDSLSVRFEGKEHPLTPAQGQMMKVLWDAYQSGHPTVSKAKLLAAVERETSQVRDSWRNSPLWNVLIVAARRGSYRLDLPKQSRVSKYPANTGQIPG
jgi:hypothetical protein